GYSRRCVNGAPRVVRLPERLAYWLARCSAELCPQRGEHSVRVPQRRTRPFAHTHLTMADCPSAGVDPLSGQSLPCHQPATSYLKDRAGARQGGEGLPRVADKDHLLCPKGPDRAVHAIAGTREIFLAAGRPACER